jgi:hypothetical protein
MSRKARSGPSRCSSGTGSHWKGSQKLPFGKASVAADDSFVRWIARADARKKCCGDHSKLRNERLESRRMKP